MKSSYIETNIINKSLDLDISGGELRSQLDARALTPKFGIHGIYELARSFLNDDSRERAISLFCVLRDLDPGYQVPVDKILEQEIIKLRTGSAVLPFLPYFNQIETKQEVEKLAHGVFDEKAKSFISNREYEIKSFYPEMAKQYIASAKSILRERPKSKKQPRTFEQLLSELESEMPDLIYRMLKGKVSLLEARELYLRLKSFPAIHASAMANAYMTSICILHGDVPGKDKIDDYRHLIEASYCDVFITDDYQLKNTVPRINSDLQVIGLNDLIEV